MTVHQPPHVPNDAEKRLVHQLHLDASDEFAKVMFRLADEAIKNKLYDDAINIVKGVVTRRPEDLKCYELFASIYQLTQKPLDALVCFEHIVKLCPDHLPARVNAGELAWQQQKDAAKAKDYLTYVVNKEPTGLHATRAQFTLKQMA